MSTITREFTKEQLQQIIETDHVQCGEASALARIELASLEAEPVAWIVHARTGDQLTADGHYVANAEGILGLHSTPLYMTPQQAPVVVDEIAEQSGIDPDIADAYMQGVNDTNQRKLADIIPSAIPEGLTGQIVYLCAFDNMPRHELATRIWNACRDAIVHTELSVRSDCSWCDGEGYVEIDHGFEMGVEQKECRHCRAAMLHGAEQPQNQQQNIPENIPVNTPCKEAPEHIWLQTAGVWPENGEFSELTWCSDNQHKDDTLYVRADVVTGNSLGVSDGWVACSERMPDSQEWVIVFAKWANQQVLCWDDVANRWTDFEDQSYFPDMFSHWMPLPAAPQQEAKNV